MPQSQVNLVFNRFHRNIQFFGDFFVRKFVFTTQFENLLPFFGKLLDDSVNLIFNGMVIHLINGRDVVSAEVLFKVLEKLLVF